MIFAQGRACKMKNVLLPLLLLPGIASGVQAQEGGRALPTGFYSVVRQGGVPIAYPYKADSLIIIDTAALATVTDFRSVGLRYGLMFTPGVAVYFKPETLDRLRRKAEAQSDERVVFLIKGAMFGRSVRLDSFAAGNFLLYAHMDSFREPVALDTLRSEMHFTPSAADLAIDELGMTIDYLDASLLSRDTSMLNMHLHRSLTFIHSNGWNQTKADVLAHAASGKLVYKSIRMEGEPDITLSDESATVHRTLDVSGLLSGTAFGLKIRVLEVWKKEDTRWQLVFRQSSKMP